MKITCKMFFSIGRYIFIVTERVNALYLLLPVLDNSWNSPSTRICSCKPALTNYGVAEACKWFTKLGVATF